MSENVSNNYQGERISKLEAKMDLILSSFAEMRGALEKLSLIMESKEDQRQSKCELYRKDLWKEIDGLKEQLAQRNLDLQTFKTKVLTAAGLVAFVLGIVGRFLPKIFGG